MTDVTFVDVLTDWQVDPAAVVVLGASAWAYAVGVRRLARRGRRWPPSRLWLWGGAIAAGVVATQSGIGRYDTERLSVHMGQHLLLGMVVPLLVVCVAPVTLVLQAGGPGTTRVLRRALHSPAGRLLAHPVVTWLLFGGALVAVYLTPLLEVIARNGAVHLLVHVHFVVAGCLFLTGLVAIDPSPRPLHPAAAMLAILLAVPFHAFLGLAMASADTPLAPVAYPSMSDQQAAAALLWGIGEPFTLVVAAIVARRWYVADQREAARADRRADAACDPTLRWAGDEMTTFEADDHTDAVVRVGLVGGGPWATMVHAPMLASSGAVDLVGVWTRRPEAAAELAGRHHVAAFDSYDALLGEVDAVAFAVPPEVQASLALVAARAGKSLLLEKPIAGDLAGAERLAEGCGEAGVGSQVLLTWRYATAVRAFLAEVTGSGDAWLGGRGVFLGGFQLGGPFATPWRLERGPLLDLGPHVVDLLDAALGPVVEVRASGDLLGWIGLLLTHESGAVSDVGLSAAVEAEAGHSGIEVFGRSRSLAVDPQRALDAEVFATVADDFARTASGVPHELDVRRGLHLQRILADAEAQLRA